MNFTNYFELSKEFSEVYLEDSYVLGYLEDYNQLEFLIEFVLTEKSPFYSSPESGNQYCYKKGRLIFPGIKAIEWKRQTFKKTTDLNGEIDYGNIDSFVKEEKKYHLSGDWGEVFIESEAPQLNFRT